MTYFRFKFFSLLSLSLFWLLTIRLLSIAKHNSTQRQEALTEKSLEKKNRSSSGSVESMTSETEKNRTTTMRKMLLKKKLKSKNIWWLMVVFFFVISFLSLGTFFMALLRASSTPINVYLYKFNESRGNSTNNKQITTAKKYNIQQQQQQQTHKCSNSFYGKM